MSQGCQMSDFFTDTVNGLLNLGGKATESVNNTNTTVKEVMKEAKDFMYYIKPASIIMGVILTTKWITEIMLNHKELTHGRRK